MRFHYDTIGERFVEARTAAAYAAADTHTLLGALDALGGVHGLDTIDLACGYGYNTRLLARGGARRAVGVDVSEEMIRLARAHGVIGGGGVGALEDAVGAVRPVGAADAAGAAGGAVTEGVRDAGGAASGAGQGAGAAPAVEYVVADAARLPQMGPFDLATAVYLFNQAADRSVLHAMFRSIRANLREGGRLLAIVPNAGAYPHVDWSPYGVRIVDRVLEGDAPLLKAQFLTRPPADFEFREWAHADFAEAAVEAGFSTVGWQPNRTPPAEGARDEAYWTAYRAWPISSLMTCTA
ncbi:class I SAM-dependent methyltransferase [Streptomyces roseus]|uniref:Methyltransferase n=1 Tax=Streptomyces roseus TaxID=66430 RepID=A0A0J7AAX8_9ACTN|nr:class I SAM-dependent methyltransferase [Streptomyces roseus]KMO94426.1 methyltransferase [Streptomyces roseus]